MNGKNTSSATVSRDLLNRVWAVTSVDELERFLADDDEALQNIERPELALAAYSQLRQLTFDDPVRAKRHILEGLVEWCCKASGEACSLSEMQAYEFRTLLEKWLYQYEFEQHVGIRSNVLKKVTASLEREPSKEKLWTIAAIGLRTERVVTIVERILLGSNESLADTALSVLVGLGVPPSHFDALLDIIAGKLQADQLTRSCFHAIQELPGPARTELATEILRVAKTIDEDNIDSSLAFSVVAKVAGRSPENYALHKEIWKIFSQHWRIMQRTPDYANACDLEEVISFHILQIVEDDDPHKNEIGAYILLSRLAELIKPHQLAGWNEPVSQQFAAGLERYATLDTKNIGRFTTTRHHLKEDAWKTALVAGVAQTERWIDAAVLDETDPSAAHSIAIVAACVKPRELSDRFLQSLQRECEESDLVRHVGMTELAHSCCDRRSFDSLLNFGLTNKGHVLLSTVHAIRDCALARIREGDGDIVEKVLDQTAPGNEYRHRVAAINVFCELVLAGDVPNSDCVRLWDFAFDEKLDEFSRIDALEAISQSDTEIDLRHREQLVEMAHKEGEVGWRSCEVLIKRELATVQDEWLRQKLRLVKSDDRSVELADHVEIEVWQAYLIGCMFQREPVKFASAIAQVIEDHSDSSLFHLFQSLEHLNRDCPFNVVVSLVKRVIKSNSTVRTNLELIKVLQSVSPSQLLALVKACDWPNWMPVAKATLCEMVAATATDCLELRNDCIALLLDFVHDASFHVRRSAYRGLANVSTEQLYRLADRWSRTGEVELRKRGAECVTWLPRDAYPDVEILKLGFGWDEEPSVREAFKDIIERRRRLQLSRQYLKNLLQDCLGPNGVFETYRFARALEQIGDDESAQKIDAFMASDRPLPPHVRHYLKETAKAIRKNWKKETEKWPEPWSHETAIVETVSGQLIVPGREPIDAVFTLRCRHRKHPSELGEWSATAVAKGTPGTIGFELPDEPVTMCLQDRGEANVYVFGKSWRDNGNTAIFTLGGGISEYPAEMQQDAAPVATIHDQVREAIKHSGASLVDEAKDNPADNIAVLIEEAELSFFEMGSSAGLKQVCQVTSVVLASIVRLFKNEPQTSVLLWRIAGTILGHHAHVLRLTPVEADELQKLSRQSDPHAPDELLFWLLERATPEDKTMAAQQTTQFKPL